MASSSQPTASPTNENTIFSIRIVAIDYYMTPPIPDYDICYSTFHGGAVEKVPVIRIYGSTLAGQKTCLHVHRALPYLYIPCSDIGIQITERGDKHLHDVFLAVEKALSGKSSLGYKKQHVHGCSFVRAKRLYGYHSSEELFIKIYLYYPNEVSRASIQLLGGSILDRVIQPYESHIPFLLQFLIDYNLYGMSHVHAARIKFRQPLPDNVRSGFYRKQSMDTEKLPCSPVSSQADSSSEKVQSSAIWVSSTVPREWTWGFSSAENDGSLIKRQSTCELEVDSCVDDILNQLSKIYISLSQSRTDMKMVQSLVPIWNEEYKRSGIEENVRLFKDDKPSPESVLESFLDRTQYNIAFSSLFSEIKTPFSAKVSSHVVEAIEDAKLSLNATISGLNTDDLLTLAGEALPKIDGSRMSLQGENVITNLRPISESASLANTSKVVGAMVSDTEDARLLSWLASSQAMDELNSDDELGRDVILSPLFPTKSHDKLLEKAHLDYEIISQRECQDILDTIEDTKNKNLNPGKASFSECEFVSSDSVIPQLDGSCDGEVGSPLGKECETNITSKSAADDTHHGENNLSKIGVQRKKSTFLWGTLPISSKKKDLEGLECSSGKSSEAVFNETMHEKDTGLSVNKAGKDCDTSKTYASPLEGRSLRDLMRKKRLHHADVVECKISQVQRACILDRGICEGQSHLGNIKCHINQEDKTAENSLVLVDGSNCTRHPLICSEELKKYSLQSSRENATIEPIVKTLTEENLGCRLLNCSVECSSFPGQPCLMKDGKSCAACAVSGILDNAGLAIQQSNVDCFSGDLLSEAYTCKEERKINSSDFPYTFHVDVNGKKCRSESYEMVFSRKPPTAEQVMDSTNDHFAASIVEGPYDSRSFLKNEREYVPSSLPFFMRETEDTVSSNQSEDHSYFSHDVASGVPVHFQNDGSVLYLLSFALSPPSLEHVSKWLLDLREQDYQAGSSHLAWFEKPPKTSSFGDVDDVNCGIYKVEDSGHVIKSQVPVVENVNRISPQSQDMCGSMATLVHSDIVKGKNSTKENSASDTGNIAIKQLAAVSAGLEHNSYLQDASQISGPDRKSDLTPLSQIGFRDPATIGKGQQLTLLSIEILAHSRGELRPDPRLDAVNVVTVVIQEDCSLDPVVYVFLHSFDKELSWRDANRVFGCICVICLDERGMFQHLMKLISSMDPDILMGWEAQSSSLGFLAERATEIGINFLRSISRTPASGDLKGLEDDEKKDINCFVEDSQATQSVIVEDSMFEDEWGRTHASGFHIRGRIVLNLWRLMRAEIKLNMYTIEAVAEEVLRIKVPYFPSSVLNSWFTCNRQRARFRCIGYIIEKTKLNLAIVNQLDMINRTSELARVFGIDFFSVLSRGSQYRVESMLLRLAHTQNYLAISPGSQQVALQPAMECLPLVMEPMSGFYADPVVVLDFQSLYPSMIIAYNLCYSTCLGKLMSLEENVLGVGSYSMDRKLLQNLTHQILLSPNGVMYVPRKVRQGVLPRLLEEILTTRIMIKQKMKKLDSSKRILHRIYNARQLALKLIANVSYGYTAAGFSGRMPCAELADSIVQCGRRTLETAISFVNTNSKWNARVVYGDTDSMFVHLKGRTVEEAYKIGNEIATMITSMNPNPVTLKLEKVYHPCFLLTKKRYVGYSYESPGQKTPIFDAKGIETVRRDTCPAVPKILERSLRMFFEHQDITMIKSYLQRQWMRILRGKCSLQDFIFAKEVRLGTYCANASSLPPAAIVATKRMKSDPRSEPLYAERVPYVVIHGEPGARLVDMVVDPREILDIGSPYRLNDTYYINKQIIPALQRIFGLLGVEMKEWYSDIPRPARSTLSKCYSYGPTVGCTYEAPSNKQVMSRKHAKRSRIDSYYLSKHCCICGGVTESSACVCKDCSMNEAVVVAIITGKTSKSEREMQHLSAICGHCGGTDGVMENGVKCSSLACSVFYERRKVQKELLTLSTVASEAGLYPRCMVEWF